MAHEDVCVSSALGVVAGAGVMDGAPGKKPDFNIRMSGFPEDDGRWACASSVLCDCSSWDADRGIMYVAVMTVAVCCAAQKLQALSPWTMRPKVRRPHR